MKRNQLFDRFLKMMEKRKQFRVGFFFVYFVEYRRVKFIFLFFAVENGDTPHGPGWLLQLRGVYSEEKETQPNAVQTTQDVIRQ